LIAQAASPRPIDPAALGPAVGQTVPSFEAPDQDGTPRSLSSLMGPNGLVLVFHRSADW
jgi:peroxiredoxin